MVPRVRDDHAPIARHGRIRRVGVAAGAAEVEHEGARGVAVLVDRALGVDVTEVERLRGRVDGEIVGRQVLPEVRSPVARRVLRLERAVGVEALDVVVPVVADQDVAVG